ncbi:MAG: 5'/3'-nucleotidase SurE [Spirochaetes bacterium]|nr:5'/3'-nucleotidase SurE [Spirochaetota bacterium]
MAILITNDDGVHAPGIKALAAALSTVAPVYVVAPVEERSGCSHSVAIGKTFDMIKLDERTYALASTPADCVRAGLLGLITDDTIDLVVCGINRGMNVGYDIHYSGTVAGAREACIGDVSSLAVSLNNYSADADYTAAAGIARAMVKQLYAEGYTNGKRIFLNMNVPDLPANKIKGVRKTVIARRIYKDYFTIKETNGSTSVVTFSGAIPDGDRDEHTDFGAVLGGYISVTPLSLRYETPADDIAPLMRGLV